LIAVFLLFSLVGSLNKIPISVAGVLLFHVPVSVENLFSIVFGEYFVSLLLIITLPKTVCLIYFYLVITFTGLFAGIFFAKAKMSKS
jgi:GDP-mannose transporter